MEFRRLGTTPFSVSRIGLGGATFGREIDEAQSINLLDAALDAGINFIDTAEAYGAGQARAGRAKLQGFEDKLERGDEFSSSERIIGRWLKQRRCRDRIILQSKLLPPLTPERIFETIDATLSRLQTDHLDFYLAHAFDPATPLQETVGAFEHLITQGKIRYFGCSNFELPAMHDLHRLSPPAHFQTVQMNYNLAVPDIEREVLPFCRNQSIGMQTYSPLGAGFLTGKYTLTGPMPERSRFQIVPGHSDIYFTPEKFDLVERLRTAAAVSGRSMSELALQWVLSNQLVDVMLVGTRHAGHLDTAITALNSAVQREEVEAILHGNRVP